MEGKLRLLWEYVGLEMPERYRCKIKNQAKSASLALRSRIRGNILEFRTQVLPKARERKEPGEWMQMKKSIKQRLSEPRDASVIRVRAASKEDEKSLAEHWGEGGARCDVRQGKMVNVEEETEQSAKRSTVLGEFETTVVGTEVLSLTSLVKSNPSELGGLYEWMKGSPSMNNSW